MRVWSGVLRETLCIISHTADSAVEVPGLFFCRFHLRVSVALSFVVQPLRWIRLHTGLSLIVVDFCSVAYV